MFHILLISFFLAIISLSISVEQFVQQESIIENSIENKIEIKNAHSLDQEYTKIYKEDIDSIKEELLGSLSHLNLLNGPYTLQFLRSFKQNGLHGKLKTNLNISCIKDENCFFPNEIILVDAFSKHIFLDQFELSEIERILNPFSVISFEEDGTDVEKPSYRMKNDHIFTLKIHSNRCLIKEFEEPFEYCSVQKNGDIEQITEQINDLNIENSQLNMKQSHESTKTICEQKQRKVWELEFELPIHFRYQAPSLNISHSSVPLPSSPLIALIALNNHFHYEDIPNAKLQTLDTLKTMIMSLNSTHKNIENDENDLKDLKDQKKGIEIQVFVPKSNRIENLIAKIPVGKIEHQTFVSPITLFVSTLGAILLSIATLIYASNSD